MAQAEEIVFLNDEQEEIFHQKNILVLKKYSSHGFVFPKTSLVFSSKIIILYSI